MHLEAIPAGGSMATLLTHKGLLTPVLGRLVHAQLSPGQEAFGAQGALGIKQQGVVH